MSEWVSCGRMKIITVTDACVLGVKTCCWPVCSTFYDKKIRLKQWNQYTHTNVHIQYSRHTSFTDALSNTSHGM